MSVNPYLLAAYLIGLGLLWGYALHLWLEARHLRASAGRSGGEP